MSVEVSRPVTETHSAPGLLAIVDMGASAIRLVIAEQTAPGTLRVLEEASRGVLLGRDTFSQGVIGAGTAEAALKALEGFRTIIDAYGVATCRAVATSAVREARNSDAFLDRVRIRTDFEVEVISESEETRMVFLSVRRALEDHPSWKVARALIVEVGGGGAGLTVISRGLPRQSAIYSLGAVRMRQALGLWRHGHDQRMSLLRRYVANVVEDIKGEMPIRRATWVIATGGDARFVASQLLDAEPEELREIPREAFMEFCDAIAAEPEERLVDRYRLPPAEVETLVPAMLVYRALLETTVTARVVVANASLRDGLLIDLTSSEGRAAETDFEGQVLASAEALGRRYRYDADHARHVVRLAAKLFEELRPEHDLGARERLLLEVAALLHDIGTFVSLRAHHKHSQYLLSASQIFGLSNEDLAIVANVARYHRRGLPQRSHLPYVALDRNERTTVNKLAAILRIANALDAEHLQKVRTVHLRRLQEAWLLELHGTGDLTMERMATEARADLFAEVFGRRVVVRVAGVRV